MTDTTSQIDASADQPVISPCVRICRLDQATRICDGCHRTLDEIAHWGGMSVAQRRAVLELLPARRAALGLAGRG